MCWCDVCGVETYDPFHHCSPGLLRRQERRYVREELAAEDYDAREGDDPLEDGFLMLDMMDNQSA